MTTRSLAVTQWGTAEADTSTGLELRGVSSIEFDKQVSRSQCGSSLDSRQCIVEVEKSSFWRSGSP